MGAHFGSALGQSLSQIFQPMLEQRTQQMQQKRQMQQQQSKLLQSLQEAEQLPNLSAEQKQQLGLLRAFSSNPETAFQLMKQQTEMTKANKPIGGTTAQPVPPQVAQVLDSIIKSNQGMTSDELKLAADKAGIPPIYSNSYVENKRRQEEIISKENTEKLKTENKAFEKKVDRAIDRNKPVFDEARKLRRTLPVLGGDIKAMEDAISSGDEGFWSKDNMAELFHIPALRTATGAQLSGAIKSAFANTVSKFGARPNMYIEQQMAKALPEVGASKNANLARLEFLKFDHDINQKYLDTVDRLSEQYEKEFGYVPEFLERNVDDFMKEYVEKRQQEFASRLKEIQGEEKQTKGAGKAEKGFVRMQNPETGERYDIPSLDAAEARKAGWLEL